MNISFSRKFPASKKVLAGKPTNFVEKIWTGFPIPFENWGHDYESEYYDQFGNENPNGITPLPKIHTIREDKSRRWNDKKYIHFSVWKGNPYHSKTLNFAPVIRCTGTERIRISYWKGSSNPIVIIGDHILNNKAIEQLAFNDGFESVEDFFLWFDSDFEGSIIHWTPFKYIVENIDVKDHEVVEGHSDHLVDAMKYSVEPIGCLKKYDESVCDECEFIKSEQVGHPGGSSVHMVDQSRCDWGHWKEDF